MFKKVIILLVIILVPSCGYTPIYNNDMNENIGISILSIEGNNKLNKKLNMELNKYMDKNEVNLFKIKIKTDLKKDPISKDTKGNTTNFELSASASFIIYLRDKEKRLVLKENIKIRNKEDSFEQQKYENIIISNFVKSFEQKLILELNNL